MKITLLDNFKPITITLESQKDLIEMKDILVKYWTHTILHNSTYIKLDSELPRL